MITQLPSHFPFLCAATFLVWWPWLMPSDYPPFWVSPVPRYHPSNPKSCPTASHSCHFSFLWPLLLQPAASVQSFFPLKFLSSNAKIDFPCPLHQCLPQPSPLAGDVKASSSLIQNPCPKKGSKAGECRGRSSWRNCFTFSFHPGIVQGSIYKQVSLVVQAVERELILEICILEVYYLPMKCWACLSCCPLSTVLSWVL